MKLDQYNGYSVTIIWVLRAWWFNYAPVHFQLYLRMRKWDIYLSIYIVYWSQKHYLNQWWLTFNKTLRNKQWYLNHNMKFHFVKMHLKMSTPKCLPFFSLPVFPSHFQPSPAAPGVLYWSWCKALEWSTWLSVAWLPSGETCHWQLEHLVSLTWFIW